MPEFDRIIRPRRGLIPIDLAEIWRFRELLAQLTWRDISVRYKQTLLGVIWFAAQPLSSMVVFTVIFWRVAKLPSNDAPYAVMTFAALLPWQFFSGSLVRIAQSLVAAAGIIQKVYVPRLIFPISASLGGLVDFVISLVLLFGLMMYYGVAFRPHLILLPLFLVIGWCAATAMGLWLSTMNVKYRDVGQAVPFMMQIAMLLSPVAYSSSLIHEQWRFLYNMNPLVGVIDGFRWCILGPQFEPYWPGFAASLVLVALMLIGGAYYFRYFEKTFADVI